MKTMNSVRQVASAILLTAALSLVAPVNAEEAGFSLEDSIRAQIFTELKASVQSLYRNSTLVVPDIDTSTSARVASNARSTGFALPVNINNTSEKEKNPGKIN